jgi:hypothetical protein
LWADQTLTKRDSWSEILRNNTILKTSYDKVLDFHIIFYQWFCCKIFWLWTLNILYWVFLSKIKLINRKIGKAFWKKNYLSLDRIIAVKPIFYIEMTVEKVDLIFLTSSTGKFHEIWIQLKNWIISIDKTCFERKLIFYHIFNKMYTQNVWITINTKSVLITLDKHIN